MRTHMNFKANPISACSNNQASVSGSYQQNYQKKVSMIKRPQNQKQSFQQFKEGRDMIEYVKEKIRENYEMFEKGQINSELLKRNIKHKLYLPINEKEIDLAISQNRLDFKTLLRNVDNQKLCSQSLVRLGQQRNKIQSYNLADNTDIQQSMNLKNYRSFNGGDTIQTQQISNKQQSLIAIKEFIDGQIDKPNFLRNLKKLDVDTQQIFESTDINNDRYEPNSFQKLGQKVLNQFRTNDNRTKESQLLSQQQIIEKCVNENNKNYLQLFNQTESIPIQSYENLEDQFVKEEIMYDFANGQVRLKQKKVQERCSSSCKSNGDIITWKGQERSLERENAIQDRLLKIKKFKQQKQLSSDQLKFHLTVENQSYFYTPTCSSAFYSANKSSKNKHKQNQSAYLSYNNYSNQSYNGEKKFFRNESETTSTTYQESTNSNFSRNMKDDKIKRKLNVRNLNSSVGELMIDRI
ncbi:hypothetical protein ABPG72_001796 [Tetrahymena utriculariae]